MARAVSLRRRTITTAAAWLIGFLIFFPILWTVITSFKTELEAFSTPPKFLFFEWTTENYGIVQERSNYLRFVSNSLILSIGSTLVALLFAIPAAWAMAFAPAKRTKDLLMWMLSTKMMPPVGALIPVYLIFRDLGLLDSRGGLIVVLFLLNLPIIVWMLYTYFKEIPGEILEAARNHPFPDVAVIGHTDTTGTAAGNYELGLRRANAIRTRLLDAGVDRSLIDVTSHGEADLLVKTGDEIADPRNRRVEITIR